MIDFTAWKERHPSRPEIEYAEMLRAQSPAAKRERFLDAHWPGRPKGYFKWLRTDDNAFVLAVWALAASLPLFGLAMVVWSLWTRK